METSIRKVTSPQFGEIRVVDSPKGTFYGLNDIGRALHVTPITYTKWLGNATVIKVKAGAKNNKRGGLINFVSLDGLNDIVNGSGKREAKELKELLTTGSTSEAKPQPKEAKPKNPQQALTCLQEVQSQSAIIYDDDEHFRWLLSLKSEITRLRTENESLKKLVDEQEEKIRSLSESPVAPKAAYTISEIANEFGYSASVLNGMLKIIGVQYYRSGIWQLKAPYSHWNLTEMRTGKYERPDGNPGSHKLTVWNERGRIFLKALHKHGFDLSEATKSVKSELGL